MRKPTNNFFKVLNEAIKYQNEYGVDTSKNQKEPFFKSLDDLNNDYTYKGEYSYIPKEVKRQTREIYKKEDLAGTVKDRIAKKTELKKIKADMSGGDVLFTQKKEIEHARVSELQKDLIAISKEIERIKNINNTYRMSLRKILTNFFSVPGAKLSKRYLFLPLRRSVNLSQINTLNAGKVSADNMIQAMTQSKEIIVDKTIDTKIEDYLLDIGYSFKDKKNDLYNNVCYTRNGAKVKITDELEKINKINIADKEQAVKKAKDEKTKQFIENEINKKIKLKSEFISRMQLIDSDTIKSDNFDNLNVIVLTWVPRLIMSQSTTTIWTSCMKLPTREEQGGVNRHYIPGSIENGVFIAWLVNIKDMKTINNPIARILIKPFLLKEDPKHVLWWPSKMYYDGSSGGDLSIFKQAVNSFCYFKQLKEIKKIETKFSTYRFKVDSSQYDDSGDDAKKLMKMKNYFQNLKEIKPTDRGINTDTINFFNAIDYTPKRAIQYLKIANKEIVDKFLRNFIFESLKKEDLTVFDYLTKIKTKHVDADIKLALNNYFDSYILEDGANNYSYRFMVYILKYYFDGYVDEKTQRDYMILVMGEDEPRTDIAKFFLMNNDNLLTKIFNKKDIKANYATMSHFTYFVSDELPSLFSPVIKDILTVFIKNDLVNDYFGLKDATAKDVYYKNVFLAFEMYFNTLDIGLQKLWTQFFDKLKTNFNENVMNTYLKFPGVEIVLLYKQKYSRMRENTLYILNKMDMMNLSIDKYCKELNDQLKRLAGDIDVVDTEFLSQIIDIIGDEMFEIDDVKDSDFFYGIIRYTDTKTSQNFYEQKIENIIEYEDKPGPKVSTTLFEIINGLTNNITENEKDNTKKKIIVVLQKYGEYLKYSNQQKHYSILNRVLIPFLLTDIKSIIELIGKYEKVDVSFIIMNYIDEIEMATAVIDQRVQNNIINNIKTILSVYNIKKVKFTESDTFGIFLNNRYEDLAEKMMTKVYDYLFDIADFSEFKTFLKNTNQKELEAISFDIRNLKITKFFFDNIPFKDLDVSFINNLFNKYLSYSHTDFKKDDKPPSKNDIDALKIIFKDDVEFALKCTLARMDDYAIIYILNKANFVLNLFNIDREKFYLTDFFKKEFLKPIIDKNPNSLSMIIPHIINPLIEKNKKYTDIFDKYLADVLDEKNISKIYYEYLNELIRKNENEKQIKNIIKDVDRYLYSINIDKDNVYDIINAMSNIFKLLYSYDTKIVKEPVFKLFDSEKVLDRLTFLINTLSNDKFDTERQTYFFDIKDLRSKIIKLFEHEYQLHDNKMMLDFYYQFAKKTIPTFIKIHMDFRLGKKFLNDNGDMKIEVKDVNGRMMVEVTSILDEKAYAETVDEIISTIIKNFTTLYHLNMIKYNVKFIKKEK
jgi:hypothetical protein